LKVGLFPGQGIEASAVAAGLVEADDLLEKARKTLGFDIGASVFRLARNGKSALPTSIAQPAIVIASLASWNRSCEEGMSVSYLAGHSLGEYSALIASRAISFKDGMRVLAVRAGAMQRAGRRVSGGMAAVLKLDKEVVESIANDYDVDVANDNAPGQVVLSGQEQQLAAAAAAARKAGGRSVLLGVSGPFHSRHMFGAAAALEEALDGVVIRSPRIPVISNVSARPYRAPGEIRRLLIEQMTHRVRFREGMEWLWSEGVREYHDFGPGDVVGGLARRTFANCSKNEEVALATA
jgi:malonyl CoA-acyl carrier protein transacylase